MNKSNTSTILIQTRSQQFGTRAFDRVETVERETTCGDSARDKYVSFAKRFPSLVHTCGLAQAVAFAHSKAPKAYLEDLFYVMDGATTDVASFSAKLRSADLSEYMRLSHSALDAAGWLKRYAEAVLEDN